MAKKKRPNKGKGKGKTSKMKPSEPVKEAPSSDAHSNSGPSDEPETELEIEEAVSQPASAPSESTEVVVEPETETEKAAESAGANTVPSRIKAASDLEPIESSFDSAIKTGESVIASGLKAVQEKQAWYLKRWMPKLSKAERQDSCQTISTNASPGPSYYVLIVLSSLISAYGLVSNSTATVIGAMIVAPLMGPILGLALSTVLGDYKMFRRSLVAEVSGVVAVILAGIFVALIVGVSQIDFSLSEIAGRTRPTLYDLAIGLAAGFAGGYCTVHPKLRSSVAGVAIAVALVPPLAVTGLTTAGWAAGELGWKPAFGSFMLFFTNLLTIELASGLVFTFSGFKRKKDSESRASFRKPLIVKAILLILTGWFLSNQLHTLIRERLGLHRSRLVLETSLSEISGADLDSIEAHLSEDVLTVSAVVGSRTPIEPEMVARFEKVMAEKISEEVPGVATKLVIRTVSSTYASPKGYLFEPRKREPEPSEIRVRELEQGLRKQVARYPGVEMVNFQLQSANSEKKDGVTTTPVSLTVRSPYDLPPRLVAEIEDQVNAHLSQDPVFKGFRYSLTISALSVKKADRVKSVTIESPEMRTSEERAEAERVKIIRETLTEALQEGRQLQIKELRIRRIFPDIKEAAKVADSNASPTPTPTPTSSPTPTSTPVSSESGEPAPVEVFGDHFAVHLELRSSKLPNVKSLRDARTRVETIYTDRTSRKLKLEVEAVATLETELVLDTQEVEDQEAEAEKALAVQLNQYLELLVASVPGATLDGSPQLQKKTPEGDYLLAATVTSPKLLENKQVIRWQKALVKKVDGMRSLELRIENHLGKVVKLTPARRP